MRELSPKVKRVLLITLPLLILANASVLYALAARPGVSLRVLPLEAGSAVLVRAPGARVLINAGGDASILRALGETLPPWQRHLSAFVLASPSQDDAGGAPDVLARYQVTELVRPEARGSRTAEAALERAIGGTQVVYAHAGERFTLAKNVYLDVLWPPETPSVLAPENGSLALRVSCLGRSFFFADSLAGRPQAWAEALALPSDVRISSSTPPETFDCS